MLKTTTNVPVPKAIRPPSTARRVYPFAEMEVGAMFFVPGKTRNTMSPYVSSMGRKLKRKFVTRLCYMRKAKGGWVECKAEHAKAEIGVGVWREK